MLTLITLTIIMIVAQMTMMVSTIINMKTSKDREKSSPFECGFSPFNTARIPFSLRFFLIAVIFLIFDVEITLLMPSPMLMKMSSPMIFTITLMTFLIVLTLGLYYEWKKGALEWASFIYI